MSVFQASSLSAFSKQLRGLSTKLAQKVAERAASQITALAQDTFAKGEDPFGVPWAPSPDGKSVTLVKSGTLSRTIRYVAIGTKLRVALGVRYAKYQIGKRPVFPTQNGLLPVAYSRTLEAVTKEVCSEAIAGGLS